MYTRLLKAPKNSFLLLGPRGTGKTTWLRMNFQEAKTIDLLDERLYQKYLADISIFSRELNPLPPKSWVIVDEVQRLPSLLNEVHRFIEGKKLRFVFTMLREYQSLRQYFDEIYYWAPAEARQTEVDFLLIQGREKKALEVKAAARLREDHFRGLRAIAGLKGLTRRVLIYLGDEVQRTSDGIDIYPFGRFSQELARGKL